MKTEDFNYHLPGELIAQKPCSVRDRSRMMVVNRSTGVIESRYFHDFPFYLESGDALVVNDSKVIPARLVGKKATGGTIELLLLEKVSALEWTVLLRPGKRVKKGTRIFFDRSSWAEVEENVTAKKWLLSFHSDLDFDVFLERHGRAPLPPYIKRKAGNAGTADLERYQTVYASVPGSVAAPTAGLHFSDEILRLIRAKGISIAPVTLHVGYGTFLPIESETVEDHTMESESFFVSSSSASIINTAKRIVAVGTTSVRTLESSAGERGMLTMKSGSTSLFIYPGYRFKKVGALLTNFHLPSSSLFLLVCAFGGTELMKEAYSRAIEEKYRFYSYGDCMLII
ncbi:MAG: tRNA preQ1(34) S-adenosylmethionine ribosyltransferase-isomerase QueA [Syntrophales bacterium]|jgi:S-adenosylmethionine:tRNA ribosyltransferase-isomerase|nr:tRNA preQ1(34) S-adenosylmethionine ribosyltransferase-isomerase QueA [Syntrophales bacterium]MDY0043926.1 tRNA preQ1(34) S-adenosylmethionine ribosyltransferase-isomerase QueA [Syntrophales bacterium]